VQFESIPFISWTVRQLVQQAEGVPLAIPFVHAAVHSGVQGEPAMQPQLVNRMVWNAA